MTVRIGPYEVSESLGSGGMGEVFKAWDPRLERHVAIKLLHRNLGRVDSATRRFEREVRAMIALDHPNVVKVFDMHMGGRIQWYAMEYVEGADLARRLDEGETFSWERSISIVAQILDALSYVHGKGMIHRDVKPHNVLLDGEDRVRLMDFGLVKDEERSDLTRAGQVLGSLRYLPPEMVGGGPGSVATDLYQVGLVARCLVTGRLPFHEATTARELVAAIRKGLPPCPAEGPAGPIPSALRDWLDRMVSRDERKRFPDGPEAALALDRAGSGLLSSSSVALIRPLLEHAGAERPPRKGPAGPRRLPRRLGLVAVPLVLGLLAWFGTRGREGAPSPAFEELSVDARARSARIRWKARDASAATVFFECESGAGEGRRHLSVPVDGWHHCLFEDLLPSTEYAFRAVDATGRSTPRRHLRTGDLQDVRLLAQTRSSVGLRRLAMSFECDRATPAVLRFVRGDRREELLLSPRPRKRHEALLQDLEPEERITSLRLGLDGTEIPLADVEGITLRARRLRDALVALDPATRAGRIATALEAGRADEARAELDRLREHDAWKDLEAFASATSSYFASPAVPSEDRNALYLALAGLEALDAAFWSRGHAGGLNVARFYAPWLHVEHRPFHEKGRVLVDGRASPVVLRPPDMPTMWAEGLLISGLAEHMEGARTVENWTVRFVLDAAELEKKRHAILAVSLTNLDPAQVLHLRFAGKGEIFLRHDARSWPGLTTDMTKPFQDWTEKDFGEMAPFLVARISPDLFAVGRNELHLSVHAAPGLRGLGIRLQLLALRLAFE